MGNKSLQPFSKAVMDGTCQLTKTGLVFTKDVKFEEWTDVGQFVRNCEGAVLWWVGDWLNYGESKYGDKYLEAMVNTDYDYQTLRHAKSLSGKISLCRRRHTLSWAHHQEVSGLNDAEEQDQWLDKAEAENWTKADLRSAIRSQKQQKMALEDFVEGQFDIVYADPPWAYANSGFTASAESKYPTMPTEDIKAMPVASYMPANGVLFLWATNPLLPDALTVMASWGFDYKTCFVWVKKQTIAGFYALGQHELLLLGVKGQCLPECDLYKSVIDAPRRGHSQKPEVVYEMIEAMYPKRRYLEMFGRGVARAGWTVFGNEASA